MTSPASTRGRKAIWPMQIVSGLWTSSLQQYTSSAVYPRLARLHGGASYIPLVSERGGPHQLGHVFRHPLNTHLGHSICSPSLLLSTHPRSSLYSYLALYVTAPFPRLLFCPSSCSVFLLPLCLPLCSLCACLSTFFDHYLPLRDSIAIPG